MSFHVISSIEAMHFSASDFEGSYARGQAVFLVGRGCTKDFLKQDRSLCHPAIFKIAFLIATFPRVLSVAS